MRQMLALGDFVFSLSENTPYEGLTRSSDGGFVTIPRYNSKPLSQNTGQGLENISISGTWFKRDGSKNINLLKELQNRCKAQVLIDGYGNNLGQWTIKKLQEKQDKIIDDGTPLVITFTIELEEYVNENG